MAHTFRFMKILSKDQILQLSISGEDAKKTLLGKSVTITDSSGQCFIGKVEAIQDTIHDDLVSSRINDSHPFPPVGLLLNTGKFFAFLNCDTIIIED